MRFACNQPLKIMIGRISFSLLSLVILTQSLQAQQRKYVNDFLNLGVGGRGMGMAGSQVATVNDVTAPFANPAGLSLMRADFQIGYMHTEYFSSIAKYDYIGAAFPMRNRKGNIGFSLVRYAIDDIPYTINLIQPDGSVDYSKIKAISSQDFAGLITFAKPITIKKLSHIEDLNMSVGGNLKIIHRNIGSLANAWGAGIDLGAQASYKKWRFGATFRDITTTHTIWSFNFTEAEKQVLLQTGNEIVSRSSEVNTPRTILGGAYKMPIKLRDSSKSAYLLTELNTDITTDGRRYGNLINVNPLSIDPRLGLEFGYNHLFYLRSGIGNFQRVLDDTDTTNTKLRTMFQPTVGVGVRIKNFSIDYSFSRLNVQDNPLYTHFVSFRLNILRRGSAFNSPDPEHENDKLLSQRRIKK
jgi:hypothetical protein